MFLLYAVGLGLIVGYLLKGRLSRLAFLKLRFMWLILVALLIQFAIFPLLSNRPLFPYATQPLHLLSYGLAFLFIVLNYRMFPLWIIGSGAALNLLVIAVNGGYMPCSADALTHAGVHEAAVDLVRYGMHGNTVLMGETTRFNALGDLLCIPRGIPFATVLSAGDLIIALGIVWLIVKGMTARV